MEKKSNKGIMILIGVIIVILAVLCVLFATNTITFNHQKIKNEIENQENTSTKENTDQKENKIYPADKYISLEDVELSPKVSIKKVKINYLDDSATKDFYDQQETLLENAKNYAKNSNEEIFGAKYNLDYSINDNVLSIVYSIEYTDEMGNGIPDKAVTNIDLLNNKFIAEEELLKKVGTSYEQIVNEYYEEELTNWTNLNNSNGTVVDYYEVKYEDFRNNKEKYIKIGMDKIANILHTYIKNNKVVYDYYTIEKSTIFHPVGKGGWFDWKTVELGDYK